MILYIYIYIYMCVCVYIYICIWIRYIFWRNYDFLYMIMNNLTMNWFWYPENGGYSLVLTLIPNQCGLFIGTLISSQWGLFIGILILKPIGVIHWYSDTQTNGGYSLAIWYPVMGIYHDHCHKIVKNMNYIWIFELFWVL